MVQEDIKRNSKLNVRNSLIKQYKNYVESNGCLSKEDFSEKSIFILAGYFLEVHSLNPILSLIDYSSKHYITSEKANKIRTLIDIL